MPNHGDKLGENLYFCMYPMTLKTYSELALLAKAAHGYSPGLRDFSYAASACGYTEADARKKFNEMGLGRTEKYEGSGARALLQVFDTFERNIRGFFMDESSCYLACFSSKKPETDFSFKRDAAQIEMMMSVLSNKGLDYVVHFGIQRSICYALKGHPSHNNISMLLHGCAAAYMMQYAPEKKFMVTNPLESMRTIFVKHIPQDDLHHIPNFLELRQQLGLDARDRSIYLHNFQIEDLDASMYTAVSLDVLSGFSKPAIPESAIVAVPHISPDYLNWVVQHPASMVGAVGFLIAVGIVVRCYPAEVYENVEAAVSLAKTVFTSLFSTPDRPENPEGMDSRFIPK